MCRGCAGGGETLARYAADLRYYRPEIGALPTADTQNYHYPWGESEAPMNRRLFTGRKVW